MSPAAPLALTIGEPASIAGEITLKAWAAAQTDKSIPPFVALADPEWLAEQGRRLDFPVPLATVTSADRAVDEFYGALPVMTIALAKPAEIGQPNPANAATVLRSIDEAVRLTSRGATSAVVTNPIHKATMYAGGFKFPGHTEYLAELSKPAAPVMMLAIEGLRVVLGDRASAAGQGGRGARAPPQSKASRAPRTRRSSRISASPIRASPSPALNPHAGEDGALGHEEHDIIAPAIAKLRADGIEASGPHPRRHDVSSAAPANATTPRSACITIRP